MWVFNTRHDFGVETDPTQGEFFVNNEIDRNSALVRETIQNSLDARREDAQRVEVRFTFFEGPLFVRPALMEEYLSGFVRHLTASGVDPQEIDFNEHHTPFTYLGKAKVTLSQLVTHQPSKFEFKMAGPTPLEESSSNTSS